MKTKPCEKCGKPVEQTEGRKAKKYCSDKCRQDKWQADQRAIRELFKKTGGEVTTHTSVAEQISNESEPMFESWTLTPDASRKAIMGAFLKERKEIESDDAYELWKKRLIDEPRLSPKEKEKVINTPPQ